MEFIEDLNNEVTFEETGLNTPNLSDLRRVTFPTFEIKPKGTITLVITPGKPFSFVYDKGDED